MVSGRLFSSRNSSKGRQHPSSNMHCVTLVYSPFFFFVHSTVKVKKSAISSLDSSERHVFHSVMNKQLGGRSCIRGWSMVYCLSNLVSRPRCRSISSPNKYTIKSMVYCSHLPLFGIAKNDVRYPRALSALRVADLKGNLVGFDIYSHLRFNFHKAQFGHSVTRNLFTRVLSIYHVTPIRDAQGWSKAF